MLIMYAQNDCIGGYSQLFGTVFSTPAVAEKGKLDVKVEVATAGGHSSVPPAHTVSYFSPGALPSFQRHIKGNWYPIKTNYGVGG